ncbi:hypothetical protein NUH87_31040 [Pseudomonas batumici]|uniref:hypothetical protein n=1 Tax=Pseudomonas batumici TaxID=226910 RepID=UPI0030CE1418
MQAFEQELTWRIEALQPGQRLPLVWPRVTGWVERVGPLRFAIFTETSVPPAQLIQLLEQVAEQEQVLLWNGRLVVCRTFERSELADLYAFVQRYCAQGQALISANSQEK